MVSIHRRATIAVLEIANPPVNAISGDVAAALASATDELIADPGVEAIVVSGSAGTFVAGADIKMLSAVVGGKIPLPDLNTYLFKLEGSPKPVIAAIDGPALGGGLETAMAAHYRIASSGATFGQPEVKLGLIPGMGGTQRLPRLVGLEKALEICISGEPIKASDALHYGLVDRVVDADAVTAAIEFAHSVFGVPRSTATKNSPSAPPSLFAEWRERAQRVRRGEEAPLAAIEAIENAASGSFDSGFRREQELFRERLRSPQSKAMLHVFLGERTVSKIPGLRTEQRPKKITRAAVLGAGFMGSGISMAFANAGIPVRLTDISELAFEKAARSIQARCKQPDLIDIRPGFDGFEGADVIVEAVFEDLAAKQEAFTEIARVASEGCLLATNTSTLDIAEIARVSNQPDRFIGLHFFSPAQVMRLLEVVRSEKTSDATIESAMALGKQLGKIAVLSQNTFGFIGNRMVLPYLREAHVLVEEGVSVEQINRAIYDFGMPMGPLAMEDLVGLDVTYQMRQEAIRRGYLNDPQPRIADLLYRSGRYGQKAGAGWSRYDDKRKPSPNPEIADLLGGRVHQVSDDEIVRRCMGALVAEGRKVVAEGVALRPVDVDIVYVYGYGYPAWRGGPLHYSDTPAIGV